MIKVIIKYENEEEKQKVIQAIEKESKIMKISKPYKSNKYSRIYIDTKLKVWYNNKCKNNIWSTLTKGGKALDINSHGKYTGKSIKIAYIFSWLFYFI